ncbi:hypothetical protein [Polaromonas sp.]|uniref:hypothetical protein n=1 Tax=Polaromonas sp. TaxID=1869339 RepID=UPI002731CA07|nr:hypothetical protein [Polaromonas sp.]MDP1740987.1 hypothetical protein [Polaromonas sp.]
MKSPEKIGDLLLPIVKKSSKYRGYPLGALTDDAKDRFADSLRHGKRGLQSHKQICKLFECFIFLNDAVVTAKDLKTPLFRDLSLKFIGALNSSKFIDTAPNVRLQLTRAFLLILEDLGIAHPEVRDERPHYSDQVNELVRLFEAIEVDEEEVWLFRGWWTENRKGTAIQLPLYPLYARFGRAFTQTVYDACDGYISVRSGNLTGAFRAFINYLSARPSLVAEDLQNKIYAARFWIDFLVHYSEVSYADGQGNKASQIVNSWNIHFIPFVKDCLLPTGLFVAPLGGFPHPKPHRVPGSARKTSVKDGQAVKTNLLTHVPLNVTDAEAMKLLFFSIRRDFDLILQWANAKAERVERCIKEREEMAEVGQPRVIQQIGARGSGQRYLTSHENPSVWHNAATTFKHQGFKPSTDAKAILLYPQPIGETAIRLGLPVTGSELPFLSILVAEHPSITPSYLENLELFDSSGKQIGLIETDAGWYLIGYKDRRGSENSQQKILLSSTSLKAVGTLIALTQPIRKYLRDNSDSNWRYLLLNSGQGFGYPRRTKKLTTNTSSPSSVKRNAASIAEVCGLQPNEALSLAKRFSLSSLRVTKGVLIYLETGSTAKMAKALGHKEYAPDLLSHYLPTVILDFFQERWIRQFQTGMIAAALEHSPFLYVATEMDEKKLNSFLLQNALKKLPEDMDSTAPAEPGEIIFGLDAGIFGALLSLDQAVAFAKANGMHPGTKASTFSAITQLVCKYVESSECGREDLQAQLELARKTVRPQDMQDILYV